MTNLLRFKDAGSMREYSREQRLAGKRIALVPTMVSLRRLYRICCEKPYTHVPFRFCKHACSKHACMSVALMHAGLLACWTLVSGASSQVRVGYAATLGTTKRDKQSVGWRRDRADIVIASIYVNPTQVSNKFSQRQIAATYFFAASCPTGQPSSS